jgi:hypothetical protein
MIDKGFVFQPGDVILFKHSEKGLFRKIKEWLLESPWGHVSIFWGIATPTADELIMPWEVKDDKLIPLQVEAIGRGTLKTDLRNESGRYIKVLRHPSAGIARNAVLKAGVFARQGKRWYDYWCIIRYVLPFLITRRLFGIECGFGYQHNDKFICSEQVDADFRYTLFDDNRRFPTLPGDYEFTTLKPVTEGIFLP